MYLPGAINRRFSIVWVTLLVGCTFDGSIVRVESSTGEGDSDSQGVPVETDVSVATDSHTESMDGSDERKDTTVDSETTAAETESSDTETTFDDTDSMVDTVDTDTPSDTADMDSESDLSSLVTDAMWTFYTIADMQDGPSTGVNHIRSMVTQDPDAVALFEVGDHTHNALESEWKAHHLALQTGAQEAGAPPDHIRISASDWGNYIRFIGVMGNHDIYSSDWYDLWNQYLPGQRQLGENSEAGIYFALEYANTLFLVLDSNHESVAQTRWLRDTLDSPRGRLAKWKIAFFHEPVYPCDYKPPYVPALPWVTLFEEHGVDLVVHGHAHTFERTCPMKHGSCVTGGDQGVIYLTASGGGTSYLRSVLPTGGATISDGERTDTYACEEILDDSEDTWHHFCHYAVGDCKLIVQCFDHDLWNGGKMRHQFMIQKCDSPEGERLPPSN